MARVRWDMRLSPALAAAVDEYAAGQGLTRTAVVELALEGFLEDAAGGVPEVAGQLELEG